MGSLPALALAELALAMGRPLMTAPSGTNAMVNRNELVLKI